MAITLNSKALASAAEQIGVAQHELDEHVGMDLAAPVSLAMIAAAITRLPISLSETCRVIRGP